MRRILALLPFVLVVAALANVFWLLALAAGVPYRHYNATLAGARILAQRARLAAGDYPGGYDLLIAGTSRAMADFNAKAIALDLGARCHVRRTLAGYNLGNVADEYSSFRSHLSASALPKLLVLEFSPHAMLADSPAPARVETGRLDYHAYRTGATIDETYFSGEVQAALGIGERLTLRPGEALRLIASLRGGDHRLARLYYLLREGQGFGSRMGEAGQVLYRKYLPDGAAAALLGDSASEYGTYTALLSAPLNPASWQGFKATLDLFRTEGQIVVVRPPVHPRLYALENAKQKDLVMTVVEMLRDRGIAYIDLNPTTYHSTDWSHIDWYDTDRLSRALATRLAGSIRPALFAPGADCRAD